MEERDSTATGGRPEALIEVRGLHVEYGGHAAVRDVSFTVARGGSLAIVGGSGSGKSTTVKALLGLLPSNAKVTAGQVVYDGVTLPALDAASVRALRGSRIGLVPQDPMASLNPAMRVGDQICDSLRQHGMRSREARRARAVELMADAGIPEPERRIRQYPHEFSGGMRQRILIAIALSGEPELILADEPTSALDVTVQRRILDHLDVLAEERGLTRILVTHDLGVAADRAEEVVVMSEGEIVERGHPREILRAPSHVYARELVAAAPRLDAHRRRAPATQSDAALDISGLVKDFRIRGSREPLRAVDDVSLRIARGTTTAVIGESGSGKSTVARIALGLEQATSGETRVGTRVIRPGSRADVRYLRSLTQPVFQDPFSSLNPFWSVESLIAESLVPVRDVPSREKRRRVRDCAEQVALPASALEKYPGELSGGQRQRVAIARALVAEPELLVCDEAVSALDVLVQKQILDLLRRLQEETGVSCLFITHDLAVTAEIATEVVVLRTGRVMESGPVARVIDSPQSEYTKALLDAVPGRGV
ncbi:dipeptide ABC transporter ATP-binding protein [Brevibacterium album]|uniref:dipeptide ABC transporter ATP-binding protein n=1 Tax=Brevibacterium album TaxID=417948 RepID=UPI000415999B|nr:ABC transporter ATP-binding protein [Brevibacterium album]